MRTLLTLLAVATCGQDPPPGKALEVKRVSSPVEDGTRHEALVLAAAPGDLKARVGALLKKTPPAPLTSSDDVHLYVLLGWSGNGLDDLRRAAVDVRFDEAARAFRVLLRTARTLDTSGFSGITDVQYVGFGARVGTLAPGEYTVKVYEVRTVHKTPRDSAPAVEPEKLVRELTFTVR